MLNESYIIIYNIYTITSLLFKCICVLNFFLYIQRIILIRYLCIYFIKCDYLDILNNIYTYHNIVHVILMIYNILVYIRILIKFI